MLKIETTKLRSLHLRWHSPSDYPKEPARGCKVTRHLHQLTSLPDPTVCLTPLNARGHEYQIHQFLKENRYVNYKIIIYES